jgi:hypothetical protein
MGEGTNQSIGAWELRCGAVSTKYRKTYTGRERAYGGRSRRTRLLEDQLDRAGAGSWQIADCVEDGRLRVPFVATAENIADFFTKPLMGKDFFRMRDRVVNVPHSASSSPPSQP